MQLFLWSDPWPEYDHCLAFAVAENVEEAKDLVMRANGYSWGIGELGIQKRGPIGEPTRILDLPCAEWNQFGE